jgi:hypothetical protein
MRVMALLLSTLMISFTLAGCLQGDAPIAPSTEKSEGDGRTFVTGPDGMAVDEEPLSLNFTFSDVGETGKEPSIGIIWMGRPCYRSYFQYPYDGIGIYLDWMVG